MKFNKQTIAILIAILLAGALIGYLVGNQQILSVAKSRERSDSGNTSSNQQINESTHEQIWTCSMHPQIRQNEPGDCPICGMDLIPLEEEPNAAIDASAISMSPTAMQLANIQTAVVGKMEPVKKIGLNGKVQTDERLVYSQSSHIPGRIEELEVNFTGEYVSKGQVIASVYSPDLVTAQEELFEAQKIKKTQPQLFSAAKEKLINWKLTDGQIEKILKSGTSRETFPIRADISGYVTKKMVNTGDYVTRGEAIYEIADLSRLWILFDVYETDMGWIKEGDKISFTIESVPGETFEGTIDYLDPVIDPKTRVAKARVVKSNAALKLKPEMFVSGKVEAKLPQKSNAVVIPKTAVMWTGKRSVVYVKSTSDKGVYFNMREVELGLALGESYIVESGLQEGEEIAVHGTFSIDAAAQLAGKPSMMNPTGGAASTGHNHAGMDMPDNSEGFTSSETLTRSENTNPEFKAQLTAVYESYLKMKNAFVASDAQKVSSEAQNLKKSLQAVDMELLKGDAHILWMQQLETLTSEIKTIAGSSGIEKQRAAFSKFNSAFYESLKLFGLQNETAYYQYCPMAFGNQGAYWFSEYEHIRNPYFGDKMLKCGETREILK